MKSVHNVKTTEMSIFNQHLNLPFFLSEIRSYCQEYCINWIFTRITFFVFTKNSIILRLMAVFPNEEV